MLADCGLVLGLRVLDHVLQHSHLATLLVLPNLLLGHRRNRRHGVQVARRWSLPWRSTDNLVGGLRLITRGLVVARRSDCPRLASLHRHLLRLALRAGLGKEVLELKPSGTETRALRLGPAACLCSPSNGKEHGLHGMTNQTHRLHASRSVSTPERFVVEGLAHTSIRQALQACKLLGVQPLGRLPHLKRHVLAGVGMLVKKGPRICDCWQYLLQFTLHFLPEGRLGVPLHGGPCLLRHLSLFLLVDGRRGVCLSGLRVLVRQVPQQLLQTVI
mmetsp:Transcript_100627/g.267469  ORF Transcript_100627/g.267469 Transcript_100627/m.267469 type:complete len:273 (-) Transcript_100627:760-1578(-)